MTPIGLGAVATNKLAIPTLPLVPAKFQPPHHYMSSASNQGPMLPPSKIGPAPDAAATSSVPQPSSARADEDQADEDQAKTVDIGGQKHEDGKTPAEAASHIARNVSRESVDRGRGNSRGRGSLARGGAKGRNSERGTANQRALDKAHNDAILAGAADGIAGASELGDEVILCRFLRTLLS